MPKPPGKRRVAEHSLPPNFDVTGVDRTLPGRTRGLGSRAFDVHDLDHTPRDPSIGVAEAGIDVAHVDAANNHPSIDVSHVDEGLRNPTVDVADVDRMLREPAHTLRSPAFDVVDVEVTVPNPTIDVRDVEIDVLDIDLGNNSPSIDVRDVDEELRNPNIDVADVEIDVARVDSGPAASSIDVRDVDLVLPLSIIDIEDVDNGLMQKENEPHDVEVVTDGPSDAPLSVRDEALPPVVPDRGTLIRGFRLLAERIPGFVHLTPEETRKMIRSSELDEELIVAALAAVDAWDRKQAESWLRMPPEEYVELDRTIRESDEVIAELRILLRGMEGANRVRKFRRGRATFGLYRGLQVLVDSPSGHTNSMRPYFENMQSAYMKNRKRKKAKEPAAAE